MNTPVQPGVQFIVDKKTHSVQIDSNTNQFASIEDARRWALSVNRAVMQDLSPHFTEAAIDELGVRVRVGDVIGRLAKSQKEYGLLRWDAWSNKWWFSGV